MSWSYKITTLYLGFVALILSLVIISSNNKEELVANDYYAQELNYQNKIDAVNNANTLDYTIEHLVGNTSVTLSVPPEHLTSFSAGEIYFFCPSNSANDVKLKMQFDKNGKQVISNDLLKQGAYKLQLSWSDSKTSFFKESIVTIKK